MALFDENGSEVEGAMTSEEIEELVEERKEEIETSNQETISNLEDTHREVLEDLQTKIDEKEEALEKEQSKDKNFGNLRKTTKEKQEEITKLQSEMKEMKTSFETKFSEAKTGSIQEKINEHISKLAGTNKELKEKIAFNLQSFKVPENTEEALKQVDNAFTLSSDGKSSIINSKVISSAGGVSIPTKEKMTPEGKDFAKKIGITDQEIKKYGTS
jgi:DNA repair exonuclease SbcCD ATPase subunit